MMTLTDKAMLIVAFTQEHFNDEKFSNFFDYNDLGVPLALSYVQGHVVLRPEGEKMLLETWFDLCGHVRAAPNGKYESLAELYDGQESTESPIDIQLSIDWNNDGHRAFLSGDADKALYFWNQASLFGQPNAITSLLWLNLLLNRFDELDSIMNGYVEKTRNWRSQYDSIVGDPAIGARQFDGQKSATFSNCALSEWLRGDTASSKSFLGAAGDNAEATFLRKVIAGVPLSEMNLSDEISRELVAVYEKALADLERINSFDSSMTQERHGTTFADFAAAAIEGLKRH